MNTREIAAEYRLSHWAQVMRERSESGQSIKAFCENAGIHENVYYYWQRKLRESACEQVAGFQNEAAHTRLTASGFAEVRMMEPTALSALPEGVLTSQVHVEISGIRISADSTYPPDKLGQLLRELMRPC